MLRDSVNHLGTFLVLVSCLIPLASGAADFTLRGAKGDLEYHMNETNGAGAVLNREDGTLPVRGIGATANFDLGFVDADYWRSEGLLPYVGFTQIGFPLFTWTQLDIQSWQVRAGREWKCSETGCFKYFVGIRNSRIDRNILPSFGSLPLREVLDVTHAMFGISAEGRLMDIAHRPLMGLVEFSIDPQLRNTLQVDSYGLYDPITLKPGLNVDLSAHVKLSYRVAKSFSVWGAFRYVALSPNGTSFQIWNKNGIPATQVRYPGSSQSMQSILFGAEFAL